MTFEIFELRFVLNYNSNHRQAFSFGETLAIHSAISHKMYTGVAKELPKPLYNKIKLCLREIKETSYKPVIVRYESDGVDLITKIIEQ